MAKAGERRGTRNNPVNDPETPPSSPSGVRPTPSGERPTQSEIRSPSAEQPIPPCDVYQMLFKSVQGIKKGWKGCLDVSYAVPWAIYSRARAQLDIPFTPALLLALETVLGVSPSNIFFDLQAANTTGYGFTFKEVVDIFVVAIASNKLRIYRDEILRNGCISGEVILRLAALLPPKLLERVQHFVNDRVRL